MAENKKSFKETIRSMSPTFWLASFLELMERWAWYGIFTLLGLYLVGSTDEGGLGFDHIQKGNIMSSGTAILYLLPLFFGVIADRIGYKLSLVIAFTIMVVGYFLMGTVHSYWAMYMVFLMVALGAAFFKPVASGLIARSTDETTGTLGFGIFYMMVNIGGFVGPAMSSYLRTQFGWKIIFIQATVVIAINLLTVLFFFKEPVVAHKEKQPILTEIKNSVMNIVDALKDKRLTILLILMMAFWTMFNQLFYTLPNFIEDWVNSSALSNWINQHLPFLGQLLTQDGQVKPEWFTNIDSLMIILLQVMVSYFVTKMKHIHAMIRGAIIATIGVSLTFFTHNWVFTVLGTMIFAIGEMASSPTLSSFIAMITPKGKEALYQGTYFLPVAAGNFFTGFIAGDLYQAWSDKFTLLQKYMGAKGMNIPEVVSSDVYTQQASQALSMNTEQFRSTFQIGQENVDWSAVVQQVRLYAEQHAIDISALPLPSKKVFFNEAANQLQMQPWELTQQLWDTYHPNKLWLVICGVGIFAVVSLYLYNLLLVRPLRSKSSGEE